MVMVRRLDEVAGASPDRRPVSLFNCARKTVFRSAFEKELQISRSAVVEPGRCRSPDHHLSCPFMHDSEPAWELPLCFGGKHRALPASTEKAVLNHELIPQPTRRRSGARTKRENLMSLVDVHNEWDPLEEIVVGTMAGARVPLADRSPARRRVRRRRHRPHPVRPLPRGRGRADRGRTRRTGRPAQDPRRDRPAPRRTRPPVDHVHPRLEHRRLLRLLPPRRLPHGRHHPHRVAHGAAIPVPGGSLAYKELFLEYLESGSRWLSAPAAPDRRHVRAQGPRGPAPAQPGARLRRRQHPPVRHRPALPGLRQRQPARRAVAPGRPGRPVHGPSRARASIRPPTSTRRSSR